MALGSHFTALRLIRGPRSARRRRGSECSLTGASSGGISATKVLHTGADPSLAEIAADRTRLENRIIDVSMVDM